MGKGIMLIDKAFIKELPALPIPDSFKFKGSKQGDMPYLIECEYESDLIPAVVDGAGLPEIIPSFYQEITGENTRSIYLKDLRVYGEFEKGKFEHREIYKREN